MCDVTLADPKKIILLIDFANDSEDKVWQKAITNLFVVLNHLGNKWLRPPGLKEKVKSLTQNVQIQNALSDIVTLYYSGYYRYSFIGNNIFANTYFSKEPFNYFLPFYEDNPSVNSIYDNYEKGGIEKFINFLTVVKLPDQLKYLICVNKTYNEDKKSTKNLVPEEYELFNEVMELTVSFYPYSNYIHEIINFFRSYPEYQHEEKLNYQFKINSTSLKDYLLNESQKFRALAMHFMKLEDMGNAIANWNNFLKLEPNDVSGLMNISSCLENNNNSEEAYRHRINIEKLDPENIDNLEKMANYFFQFKKWQNLKEYALRLIQLDKKNAEFYYYKSTALYYLHDELAIDDANTAILMDQKKARYFNIRGNILSSDKTNKEMLERAILDYNEAIEIEPGESLYYYNRGEAYEDLEEFYLALADLNKAIELEQLDKYYIGRGNLKFFLGDFKGLVSDLNAAMKINLKNSDIYNSFANYHRRVNEFDLAFEYLEKAIKIEEENRESIRVTLGVKAAIYSSMGDNENFYYYAEESFKAGARARWFNGDIVAKYIDEYRFRDLLEKYKQKI